MKTRIPGSIRVQADDAGSHRLSCDGLDVAPEYNVSIAQLGDGTERIIRRCHAAVIRDPLRSSEPLKARIEAAVRHQPIETFIRGDQHLPIVLQGQSVDPQKNRQRGIEGRVQRSVGLQSRNRG